MYEMTAEEREELVISQLTGDLWEAIEVAESSELLKRTLGDHVFEKFIANKKIEWQEYRAQVTEYELDKYLPIL